MVKQDVTSQNDLTAACGYWVKQWLPAYLKLFHKCIADLILNKR